jgi:hypothetical protein
MSRFAGLLALALVTCGLVAAPLKEASVTLEVMGLH